ncbi:hypothetical protein E2320_004293 [Naja naja]|nr:hypothetical protein E2320_004293 [Naja naja]
MVDTANICLGKCSIFFPPKDSELIPSTPHFETKDGICSKATRSHACCSFTPTDAASGPSPSLCPRSCPRSGAKGRKSQMEEVQDELIHRLTIGRNAAQKKFQVPRSSAPIVNINYESSPEDIKVWLQAKGFNSNSSGSSELQEIMKRRKEKLNAAATDSGVESFDESSGH